MQTESSEGLSETHTLTHIDARTHTHRSTALSYAARAGHLDVVRLLCDAGHHPLPPSLSSLSPSHTPIQLGK
jgi:ankyrin repeat protein